jgi:AraC family transcriptional regulator
MPIHQYVIQCRVERAKMLMMRDQLSLSDIAHETGFSHQSHMSRHMRRLLGASPRAMKGLLSESPPDNIAI